jgi:hypothetical protein
MALFEFEDKNGKIVELYYSSESAPKIGEVITVDNKKLTRIPSFLRAQVDSISKINIDDPKDFIKRTANHKGNIGELFDLSEQLSAERENRDGTDKIGTKYQEEKAKKMENRRAANKRTKEQQAKINKLKKNG